MQGSRIHRFQVTQRNKFGPATNVENINVKIQSITFKYNLFIGHFKIRIGPTPPNLSYGN